MKDLIRTGTTSGAVADWLRDKIRRGELPPGTRLRQEGVADRLGVSTTPVREAFKALQGEGLLTLDPHRGAVVFRPTAQDVRDSYEIRQALEALAIAKAIPHLTPELINELQSILDEMKATEDDQRWIDLNTLFHHRLWELSNRPRLCEMLENLQSATSAYMDMVAHNARKSGRGDAGHQAILDACRAKNVREAQRAVRAHLHHTVQQNLDLLESQPIDELTE